MESYNVVKELGNLGDYEGNSMKSLSIYILILGISMSLIMVSITGYVIGFGVGLNALAFSGASWIIGSVMIVNEE